MSVVLVSLPKVDGGVDEGEELHLDKQSQSALMVTDGKFELIIFFP